MTDKTTSRCGRQVGLEAIESGTGRLLPVDAEYSSDGVAFASGDILFGKLRPYLSKAWLADGEGAAVGDFHVYRPLSDRTDGRYLLYVALSRAFIDPVVSSVYGAKMPRASWDFIRNVEIYLPTLAEQRAIADYLDRETAQIDTLIAKQEQLIATLGERRTAMMTRAVSGNWALVPFVRCMTDQVDYRGATPPKVDDGVQLITARNVKQGSIDYDTSREFVNPADYGSIMSRGLPRVGDLLFTMEAPLGNVAIVDRADIALAQRVIKWSVNRELAEPKFLMYAALSRPFQAQLQVRATGSTALGIKSSKLPELRIPLPSLEEQRVIVADIEDHTQRIDLLTAKAQRFIELAKERRSALITAAVTGQIDVRVA